MADPAVSDALVRAFQDAYWVERDGTPRPPVERRIAAGLAAVIPAIQAEAAQVALEVAREQMLALTADLTEKAGVVMKKACLETAEAVRVEANAVTASAVAEARADERRKIAEAIRSSAESHNKKAPNTHSAYYDAMEDAAYLAEEVPW